MLQIQFSLFEASSLFPVVVTSVFLTWIFEHISLSHQKNCGFGIHVYFPIIKDVLDAFQHEFPRFPSVSLVWWHRFAGLFSTISQCSCLDEGLMKDNRLLLKQEISLVCFFFVGVDASSNNASSDWFTTSSSSSVLSMGSKLVTGT